MLLFGRNSAEDRIFVGDLPYFLVGLAFERDAGIGVFDAYAFGDRGDG